MPLTTPVLTVDADNIHKVDTANAQSLHGMWMVFSKCADYMDQGRRLENLSWRLWTRETFCVEPGKSNMASVLPKLRSEAGDLPELSASVESAASDQAERIEAHIKRPKFSDYRPAVVREDSLASLGRGKEKHITSLDLERMVLNIKEKKNLEPLAPMVEPTAPVVDITPRPSTPTPTPISVSTVSTATTARQVPAFPRPVCHPHESTESCSTTAPEGNDSDSAQINASDTSVSSSGVLPSRPELIKSPSVVRGFSPSLISSSFRSQPRLAAEPSPSHETPQLKSSPLKKKGGMFTLGGSSGDDDESSFEERINAKVPQDITTGGGSLRPNGSNPSSSKKVASFSDHVQTIRPPKSPLIADEDAIETDDEVSESAIEDDEDSDWEDSVTESGKSSVDERPEMFQRVDSRPNLVSRRSLLTMMMHQPTKMNGNAFRSSPALQRSRLTSPNGPSIPASPSEKGEDENLTMRGPGVPRSNPITMKSPPSQSVAHSPRTTRRNMLATELTESLRRHLLWERQQKSATANAFLKRRHTAHDMKNLQEYPKGPHRAPGAGPSGPSGSGDANAGSQARDKDLSKNGSWTNYATDYGPWEYHVKGW
ncbi:Mitochondrial carrier protein [Penicillium atrosanguineum]|uniref:Mitochondrial carrier protein n=1 Tax=Penicillium atrosanguineum TaxID=1132637 RepID=UPI002390C682|nr:Mitochondrial carrier protein [Penicillium atrosanguineum]KAJ5292925.1 Mitochondrial carrier protein [Penicillium atrosanguineum]